MKLQKKKKEFNDLLLPIILVLAVVPLLTRLIVYDSRLSQYNWYSNLGTVTDFFTYYKSVVFTIIAVISAVILIVYMLLHSKQKKDLNPFLLLGIYSLFAVISTILSVDTKTSVVGGMGRFENILVLIGYMIMILYAYLINKSDEDYRTLFKVIVIVLSFMAIIGVLQTLGLDLMTMEWFQRFIIPREYWKEYVGNLQSYLSSNAVSLTLNNPNYAAVYLSMLIPFLLVFLLPSRTSGIIGKNSFITEKRKRNGLGAFLIILCILLYKTYSRAGLMSLLGTLIIVGIYYRKLWKKNLLRVSLLVLLGILLFIGLDAMNQFRYSKKLIGTALSFTKGSGNSLEEILTTQEGIIIRYKEETISVAFSDDLATEIMFHTVDGENISSYYNVAKEQLQWKQFEELSFRIEAVETKNYIVIGMDKYHWNFLQTENEGYVYINDLGKPDKLNRINRIGFQNLEHIASGRGYIWSRSIPLLKETLLLGKGPDTFLLVFPQSDYVGKSNNCKTPYTIIEKPHNLYLSIGIQTGILSLISFLGFYILYLLKTHKAFQNNTLTTIKERMGFACLLATISYMISGFFNDSSLQTTPVFCILLGLGMDINHQIRKANK